MIKFPTLKWVKSSLRNNLVKPFRPKIIKAYIVGSFARGDFNDGSDLDIAIIIAQRRGMSSLQISESYHSNFTSDIFKAKWNGRIVDFQFFYENELEDYIKIELF